MEEKEIIVIGGGPAGYAAAIRASQLGGKITLIEKDEIGGTCLFSGCIPLKVLRYGAQLLDSARICKDYGISFQDLRFEYSKLLMRKDTIIRGLKGGLNLLFEGYGIELLKGRAKILSPHRVIFEAEDGEKREFFGRKIILATGARFVKIDGNMGIEPKDLFSLDNIPESLAILGGDVIGVAVASVFSAFGTRVTLIESSRDMLRGFDRETVSVLEKALKASKVEILKSARIKEIDEKENFIVLDYEGAERKVKSPYLLCTEREVMLEESIDVKIRKNEEGGVFVNERMETGLDGLYACGDITMKQMFASVAYMEGITAAENAMGVKKELDYRVLPIFSYSIPEIVSCGLTEEEAISQGYDIKVGRFPFAQSGAAMIEGKRIGLIKIICDKKYGQILGVHIVGPRATELISEAQVAIKLEATFEDLASLFHCHPSLSEGLWEAARDIEKKAIHVFSQKK